MSYQIPPDVEERVKARITAGAYQSEDDVLRQALAALDAREQELESRWHERNQIALEQSRRGMSKPLDLEAVLDRVEKRVAEASQGE